MRPEDLFGLKQEKLILRSKCREVFTPHEPVRSIELFLGRQHEVNALIEHINTPGQHALLFGNRGVGKSSLAMITSHLLLDRLIPGKLYYERCDSWRGFSSLIADPLKDAGVDLELRSKTTARESGGDAGLKIPVASAKIVSKRTATETYDKTIQVTPAVAAKTLAGRSGLLVIDEADLLQPKLERQKLAELIKHLSDSGSRFKILIVGVADIGSDLIGAHKSVQRCLRETHLYRMEQKELVALVEKGAKKLQLSFDRDVIIHIAQLSYGYPHFTHLLALKCAEDAIAEGRGTITNFHLRTAIWEAVKDAEASLKRQYSEAIRSKKTDKYKKILLAAAKVEKPEIPGTDLQEELEYILGEEISQKSISRYYRRLVANDSSKILRRKARGFFVFSDPRMRAYIRLANSDYFKLSNKAN